MAKPVRNAGDLRRLFPSLGFLRDQSMHDTWYYAIQPYDAAVPDVGTAICSASGRTAAAAAANLARRLVAMGYTPAEEVEL